MVKDPVCGMEVEEKIAQYKSIHSNNVFYFCSATCQTKFNESPEKYLQRENEKRHASHYGGFCGTTGCGPPAKGLAWYFYIGLLFMLLLLLLFFAR